MIFIIIKVICALNFLFFFQHIITAIFVYKLGRFYNFPTTYQLSDLILAVTSGITIYWIRDEIEANVWTDSDLSQEEIDFRYIFNLSNIEFPFRYLFAIIAFCLIFRISIIL